MSKCPICDQDKVLAYFPDANSQMCLDCYKQRDKEKIKKELIEGTKGTIDFQKEQFHNRELFGHVYQTPKVELICSICNKSVDKVIMTIETEHDPQKQNPFNYNFKTVYHCKNCLMEWLGLNNHKENSSNK